MKPFTVTLTHTLTSEQISDILTSALEGGSNYWCRVVDCLAPMTTWEFDSEPKSEQGHWAQDFPLNPGGKVLIVDKLDGDAGVLTLDAEAIQKGLNVLAEKYPWHITNILSENDDAETGDVLLQCSLFGDIIYS